MKKLIVFLLCFCFLFSVLSASAETTNPTIVVGAADCKTGETVEIPVGFQNNPGICTFFFKVSYDSSKLKYNGATVNKAFSSSIQNGTDTVGWMNMQNSTYNGEIFTLSFTALEDAACGETEVTLSYKNGDICNWLEEDVEFTVSGAKINILQSSYNPGDIDGDAKTNLNDLVTIAQYAAGWNNLEINNSALDVNGDGSVDLEDVNHLARYLAGWEGIVLH